MLDRLRAAITGHDPDAVTMVVGPTSGTVRGSEGRVVVAGPDLRATRRAALGKVLALAATRGRPVTVDASAPEGRTRLIVYPNGTVAEDPVPSTRNRGLAVALAAAVAVALIVLAVVVITTAGDETAPVADSTTTGPTITATPSTGQTPTATPSKKLGKNSSSHKPGKKSGGNKKSGTKKNDGKKNGRKKNGRKGSGRH